MLLRGAIIVLILAMCAAAAWAWPLRGRTGLAPYPSPALTGETAGGGECSGSALTFDGVNCITFDGVNALTF